MIYSYKWERHVTDADGKTIKVTTAVKVYFNELKMGSWTAPVIIRVLPPPIVAIQGKHKFDNPHGNYLAKCKCGCNKTFYWDTIKHIWVEK